MHLALLHRPAVRDPWRPMPAPVVQAPRTSCRAYVTRLRSNWSLGVQLRRRRVLVGTQEEVAARLGVGQDQISRWENCRQLPRLEWLPAIAIALSKVPAPSPRLREVAEQVARGHCLAFELSTKGGVALIVVVPLMNTNM